MVQSEAILQLARLLGRAEFRRHLGVDGGAIPAVLDQSQLALLRGLVDDRCDLLTAGLLQEAMASDDVQGSEAALAYLDDRLRFLGDLLTTDQRGRIQQSFAVAAKDWG